MIRNRTIWAVALAFALASCGGEKPTEPEELLEHPSAEAERISALNSSLSFVLEHAKPSIAQREALAATLERIIRKESGNALPAPPAPREQQVKEHLGRIVSDIDPAAFFEKFKGTYTLVYEQIADNNHEELWGRTYREDELAGEVWVASASDGALGDNAIQELRLSPALLFYDKNRALYRKYAVISVEEIEFWGLKWYFLGGIMFEDDILTANHIQFVPENVTLDDGDEDVQNDNYMGLGAFNPFFGYNATYWKRDNKFGREE